MDVGTGPDTLPQFEDRLLYHLVTLTGDRPVASYDGVSEGDLAIAMANELGVDPGLPDSPDFHASDTRGMILHAVSSLEDEGLVEAQKVMGPWSIAATRRGRQQVAEWQNAWQLNQQKLDRAIQRNILEALDRQRRDKPTARIFQVDVDQLCDELQTGRETYVANAQRLLDQGKIARLPIDQCDIADGYASITERGIQVLEAAVAPQRPLRDAQEAWVEVARLRRELQLAQRRLPALIADQELRQRCTDLLVSEDHYDRVIREACVILEDRIRAITGAGRDHYGIGLMDLAFNRRTGLIRLSSHDPEQEGAHQMFRGIMGFFRNAAGHNLISSYTQEDAIRFVVWVDLLLHMLAQVTPAATSGTPPTA